MKPNPEEAQRARDIFAKNLRYYMEKSGKTQAELAAHFEITSSTVSDWVNAKKYPRVDKMQALADYFDVLISNLREDDLARKNETSDGPIDSLEEEILKTLHELTPEYRKIALAQLVALSNSLKEKDT